MLKYMKQRPELAKHFSSSSEEDIDDEEYANDTARNVDYDRDVDSASKTVYTCVGEGGKNDANIQDEGEEGEIDVVSLDEPVDDILSDKNSEHNARDADDEKLNHAIANDEYSQLDVKGVDITTEQLDDNANTESLIVTTEGIKTTQSSEKPTNSFNVMIMTALKESPAKRLTLNEIYDFITERYPYYNETNKKSWQNSVRHNLSMNKCFVRVSRDRLDSGKGSFWTLTANASQAFIEDGRLWMGRANGSSYDRNSTSSMLRCSAFRSQGRIDMSQVRYSPYCYSNIERVPQHFGQYPYSIQNSPQVTQAQVTQGANYFTQEAQVTQAVNFLTQQSGYNSMSWYADHSKFSGNLATMGSPQNSLHRTPSPVRYQSGYSNQWVPPSGYDDLLALTRQLSPPMPAATMSTRRGQCGGTCFDNSPPVESFTNAYLNNN